MLRNLLGDPNARKLKRFTPLVTDINLLEQDLISLSDEDLKRKTNEFRERLDKVTSKKDKHNFLDKGFLNTVSS